MSLRPLGTVKEILESAGMDFSYAYDDLVFLEHNGFLLQFSEKENEVLVHVNEEADKNKVVQDLAHLQTKAEEKGMLFLSGDSYRLHEVDGENIQIEFVSAKNE